MDYQFSDRSFFYGRYLFSDSDQLVPRDERMGVWADSVSARRMNVAVGYDGIFSPRTGKVTEHRVPATPDAHPGTHWIMWDDKRKVIWMTQNWAHQIIKLEPRTGQFTITQLPHLDVPINRPMGGNWALHPDGSVWATKWGRGKARS